MRKLDKKEKRQISDLFIEYANIPFLVLSITTCFSLLDIDRELKLQEQIAIHLAVISLPLLSLSTFISKALRIYSPRLVGKNPGLEIGEAVGVACSFLGFGVYLLADSFWLMFSFLISTLAALCIYFPALHRARK